ncbi:hypothetical protein AB0903_16160 [Streptomyces sp. NPDC048389]|uniref:hypothetical protein n=1 Tax=Streptomyces sp. NPDC048389 TaxID=3154622 RepID=UPI003451E43D
MTAPRTTESTTPEAPSAGIGTVMAPDARRALTGLTHRHAEEHAAIAWAPPAESVAGDRSGEDRRAPAAPGAGQGTDAARSRVTRAGDRCCPPPAEPGPAAGRSAEDRTDPVAPTGAALPDDRPGAGPAAQAGGRSAEGRRGGVMADTESAERGGGARSAEGRHGSAADLEPVEGGGVVPVERGAVVDGAGAERGGGARSAEGRRDGGARSEGRTGAPAVAGTAGGGAGESSSERRSADPVARRGAADPVKALMHRHRELCERAVDPLEIAAGLEACGVTDRTAARFRHRDVFALAEEMYARVPRATEHTPAPVRPARAADSRAGRTGSAPWLLRALLPGVVCVLAMAGMEAAEGTLRLLVGVAGAVGVAVATALCLRRGPLRAKGRTVPSVQMWTLCLLAFAAFGQGLVREVTGGGPDGAWPMDPAPLVCLALAVAPAACCAHLYSVLARRRLERCRGLDEFAAGARPVLLAVLVLHVGALTLLLTFTGIVLPGSSPVPTAALGILLFLARLLVVHGFPESAATGLAAACAVEVSAPALLLAGRLPGLGALARPVDAVVGAWGTAAVPAIACAMAAAGLLAHAATALSRASAHTP